MMVATAAGHAWHGRRGGFGFGGGYGFPPLPRLASALDLTQAQQDQAKAILEGHRADFRQLRERSRTAHEAVRKAIEAEPVNEQAIRTAVGQASQVEADAAVLRANVRQQVLALLSPDQRTKLDEMKQSFHERRHKRAEQWRNNRAKPQQPSQPAQPAQPQQ
jgi:Spy/CpxP family protein refolding chaperone